MTTKQCIFLMALVLGLTGIAGKGGYAAEGTGNIQIKGSDTMVNLGQAWAEAFGGKNAGASVAVTGGGSGTGFSALISGTCDIAMASRTIKEKEITLAKKNGFEPKEFKVALDGIAVVVSPKNPVEKLTVDQLAAIFSGAITNWKDVGGADMPIVILSREVNSGTHIYFKEHVLRKNDAGSTQEFSPAALLMPSSQAIADEVAQNVNAIGYYGIGYVTGRQKAVFVARGADAEYISPTEANIKSGAYPISRPLLFYTKGDPQGVIKKFIDFVLSPEGQEIVRKVDFVPIQG